MIKGDEMPEFGEIKKGIEIGKQVRDKFIYCACPHCGKGGWHRFIKGKPEYVNCHSCGRKATREMASAWKGGRISDGKGYMKILLEKSNLYYCMANKDGYILEHRYVMGQTLGRPLKQWEIVHHKNRIKDDNRPENLELVSHLENLSSDLILANQEQLLREIRILRLQVKGLTEQLQGRLV